MGIQGNYNSFFTCYLKVVLEQYFENLESVPDDSISHYSNEFENSAKNQQKQKFKTLDGILNNNNYDNASPQAEHSFEYTDSKKKVKME